MKKIIPIIGVVAMTIPIAPPSYGISTGLNCCSMGMCPITCGASTTYDSRCTNTTFCTSCKTSTRTANGVTTTTTRSMTSTCSSSCHVTPSCNITSTTYKCASGYYGTATSAFAGCTKCPNNATCAGGNGSTFVCNSGTYKSLGSCIKCPSPGTSAAGSTSVSSCYIPSGTTGSDDSGSYKYTANCYY